MNIEQAKAIIKEEDLDGKNFFSIKHLHADEVAIEKRENNKYFVFSTNERMGYSGEREFTNESEALEEYIKRLRASKALNEYWKKEGLL